jgi:hypothetical protein
LHLVLAAPFISGAEIVAAATGAPEAKFREIAFPEALVARIRLTTWHPGCPVPLEDLRLLELTYWDFHARPQTGLLIVNRELAADVLAIFRKLFEHGFLIERMEPVEEYGGNDNRSMDANNTSAFNCRDVTGQPGKFSNHSWGRAIDINPLTNPMILKGKSLPPAGEAYRDRTLAWPGSILDDSFIVKLFKSYGWTWGGEWKSPDYQHFEKPAPAQKSVR